jgi:kynureninase
MSAQRTDGPGTDTVQLSDRDGFLFLHFEKPVEWVKLDPQTASRLAETMARVAYKCVAGDTPTTTAQSQITEQLRVRCKNRVAMMIRSMAAEAPVPSYELQAIRIVDAILKEAS